MAIRHAPSRLTGYSKNAGTTRSDVGSGVTKKTGLRGSRSKQVADESPPFPPQHRSAAEAQEELRHLITRRPEQLHQTGSRWKLKSVQAACEWLKPLTISGAWRSLNRLGIRLKRGRDHVHSPDLHYLEKLADIVAALDQALKSRGRIVLAFADEFTFYRQPTLA